MRLSDRGLKVLAHMLAEPKTGQSGADLYRATGVGSGTLYPMLSRFEQAGWLRGEWEKVDPKEEGRPAKRLYWLTGLGQNEARKRLSEVQSVGALTWA